MSQPSIPLSEGVSLCLADMLSETIGLLALRSWRGGTRESLSIYMIGNRIKRFARNVFGVGLLDVSVPNLPRPISEGEEKPLALYKCKLESANGNLITTFNSIESLVSSLQRLFSPSSSWPSMASPTVMHPLQSRPPPNCDEWSKIQMLSSCAQACTMGTQLALLCKLGSMDCTWFVPLLEYFALQYTGPHIDKSP
jgi:hypothetical protein